VDESGRETPSHEGRSVAQYERQMIFKLAQFARQANDPPTPFSGMAPVFVIRASLSSTFAKFAPKVGGSSPLSHQQPPTPVTGWKPNSALSKRPPLPCYPCPNHRPKSGFTAISSSACADHGSLKLRTMLLVHFPHSHVKCFA
jgi:hypothetical protein